MSEKILSISVAAYNVANYLPKLFEEFINCENRDRLDIIVVNDGSTDDGETLRVAKSYAEKYSGFIRVIDKTNGGHGSTINAGIENAVGKYFKPLDGDDWLDSKELDKLILKLIDCTADLVVCNHMFYYEKNNQTKTIQFSLETDKKMPLDNAINFLNGLQYHDVFYRTHILKSNKIRITENSFYTDSEFLVYPLKYVDSVIRYNFTPYVYRIGVEGQSVSVSGFLKHEKEHLDIFNKLVSFYEQNRKVWPASMNNFLCDLLGMLATAHLSIYFYHPCSLSSMKEAIEFDERVKQYPDIYKHCTTKTIRIWRKCRGILYIPTVLWMKLKA